MYKDPEKQREANRQASKKRRQLVKREREGMTITLENVIPVIPEQSVTYKALPHKLNLMADVINQQIIKPERTAQDNIRVSKPGDDDYVPQCETDLAKGPNPYGPQFNGKACEYPKRGKDIKCFDDLPPDVQKTIHNISESNEEFQRRTGIAIRYQHLFPDRFHSTGAAI